MSFRYEFARPALTVDVVVIGVTHDVPSLLVIRRALPPFENEWALPGGFVRIDETLEEAAHRELLEETSLSEVHLAQLHAFSGVNRDPRERTVTVAFSALVKAGEHSLHARTDARDAMWIPLHGKRARLAFDHEEIVELAKRRLAEELFDSPAALKMLPEAFTLTQAQVLFEGILGRPLDKRNFRKKMLASGMLKSTRRRQDGVAYRAPLMYALKKV